MYKRQGFYGLADTANGDWYAIPPLKFRGSVDAKIVEFLEMCIRDRSQAISLVAAIDQTRDTR